MSPDSCRQHIADLSKQCTNRIAQAEGYIKSDLLRSIWEKLLQTVEIFCLARSLVNLVIAEVQHFPQLHNAVTTMKVLLEQSRAAILQELRFVQGTDTQQAGAAKEHVTLRLGCGSPGRTGCMNVQGTSVLFHQMFASETSILSAMRSLDLHAVGLPGARLGHDFVLPRSTKCFMLSKGGPSYASVSIIVQDRFRECFVLLPELGSNRRMWVEVRVSGVTQLFWLVYYLPPDPGQGADSEWHAEMSGIMADFIGL